MRGVLTEVSADTCLSVQSVAGGGAEPLGLGAGQLWKGARVSTARWKPGLHFGQLDC